MIMHPIVRTIRLSTAGVILCLFGSVAACGPAGEGPSVEVEQTPSDSLHVLMITGGAWHDFEGQKELLTREISRRAPVRFTVVHEDGEDPQASTHQFSVLKQENWHEGVDLVLYNHCGAWVTDVEYVESIPRVHREQQLPAVALHCTMHSYRRAETDEWHNFLGLYSPRHGPTYPFDVINLAPEHPVMTTFPAQWTTPNGELYEEGELKETAIPLAHAMDRELNRYMVNVWTNDYYGVRVFGTTIGHHTETMADPVYLEMVTRGLLWAAGRLDDPDTYGGANSE